MQIKLLKLLIVGSLTISSLSLAYGGEYATVIIQNKLNVSYSLVDYYQTGTGFFSGHPNEIPATEGYAAFTGDFFSNGDTAGFTLKPLNNPNCVDDPQQKLGLCYDAKFTYSKYAPIPKVEVFEVSGSNSQSCKSCSFEFDKNNRDDITVTINTSIE